MKVYIVVFSEDYLSSDIKGVFYKKEDAFLEACLHFTKDMKAVEGKSDEWYDGLFKVTIEEHEVK